MALKITLSSFDFQSTLEKIPELIFLPEGADYWLLLPVFEKIEAQTDKLIDLGDSVQFDPTELAQVLDVIDKVIEQIKGEKEEEELLLEQDNERQLILLNRFRNLAHLGIENDVSLISQVDSE